ncbi:hypothetical protein [Moheibacter sediminis]|uniref:Uncharacterized protein n=1 Tax=Moheibacter sediminis TaxID=1434700 RepID=A0A1W2ARA5_9FLAO|nr:hypothetical protein [Moheibacter sediminis]SMC63050.1 hypothetical protein SAMN06296427_10513 [Moheibacter sediminis]
MKKSFYTFSFVLLITPLFGQVGVGTVNPQASFHVDGAADNPETGAPDASAQANDIVITETGRIGIGTIAPDTRLEINNGTTNGAIKIVDGTEGEDKILVSDADGVGTWQESSATKPAILGTYPSPSMTVDSGGAGTTKYSGTSITLTRGKWIVTAGLTIGYLNTVTTKKWLHAYLSSATGSVQAVGFTNLGASANNSAYAGSVVNGGGPSTHQIYNFLTGSSVIEVTQPSVTVYLLIENFPVGDWRYSSDAWENYFYAIPVN